MILMKKERVILQIIMIIIMKCYEKFNLNIEKMIAKNVMIKTKLLVEEETKSEGEGKGVVTKNIWTLKK
jgi:hypothetical protein